MYKLCKTEQSAARQRELELGLLEVMSVRHYDEITVSEICDRIGIPRKAFYRYFSSKEGALHALIDHTLMDLESFGIMRRSGAEPIYWVEMESLFRFWLNQKPLLDALNRSGLGGVLIQRAIDHTQRNDFGEKPLLRREGKLAREYGVTFGVCGLMSMVLQWHLGGFVQTPKEMAQIAEDLLTNPLLLDQDQIV